MYIYVFFIQDSFIQRYQDLTRHQGKRDKGRQGLYSPRTSRAVDKALSTHVHTGYAGVQRKGQEQKELKQT